MPKLIVFNNVTLDGYFTGRNGDLSWAHPNPQDAEHNAFIAENASGGGALVFGRITYLQMASYWPTPMAAQQNPGVAEHMNNLPKVVFSRTLEKADWKNTTLLRGDLATQMRQLKKTPGPDMAILGSGSLVAQLAPEGLIDEYQLLLNPIALGQGKTLFEGLKDKLRLKLTKTRPFKNGNVLLCYAPLG